MRHAWSIVILCAALGWQAGAAQSSPEGAAVRVECDERGCRADLATYVGWRVFEAQCATCHAADARGSSYAPDLLERIRAMDERRFFAALDRGYLGPRSTMPPRGRDPRVAPYYEELWSFLVARRSGALPAGAVDLLESAAPGAESLPQR